MCGFFFTLDCMGKPLNNDIGAIEQASAFIKKRGKDFLIIENYENGSILAGHARLAVQGLGEAGKQPMRSKRGDYLLLFNGEIYNHLELRKKFFPTTVEWYSNSDAETILSLIEIFGFKDTLEKLNGMFSIALYDFCSKKIFAAIDKFGEKPLYYSLGNQLIFSNNLDALRSLSKKKLSLDLESIQTYFEIGYIPSPKTIFSNIHKLCAGEYIEIDLTYGYRTEKVKKLLYYNLEDNFTKINFDNYRLVDENTCLKLLDSKLESAIVEASISEVPICASLSGGIDSGLLNYYLSKHHNGLDSYHLHCDEFGHDEFLRAELISKKIGTRLNIVEISKNNLQDALPSIASAYDEPFSDSSQIPTLLLSKVIAMDYKVCLTGDGLDELFSGYNRHVFLPKLSHNLLMMQKSKNIMSILKYFFETSLGKRSINYLNKFATCGLSQPNYGDKLYKIVNLVSRASSMSLKDLYISTLIDGKNILLQKNATKFNPEFIELNIDRSFSNDLALCFADLKTYLPNDILVKTDRASMHYSLEMRSPYLNTALLDFANSLPYRFRVNGNKGKYLLRKLFSEKIDMRGALDAKTGFSIPINKYINDVYRDKVTQLIKDQPLGNIIDYIFLGKIWNKYLVSEPENTQTIWRFLCFIIWAEKRGYA